MADTCSTCESLQPLVPIAQQIQQFMDHVMLGNGAVQLENVKLVVTDHNMEHIVVLGSGSASGWQKPFGVDATVKCIICDELAHSDLICGECRNAIISVRSGDFGELVQLAQDFPVSALSTAISEGLLQKWLEQQIEEMEGMNEQPTEI